MHGPAKRLGKGFIPYFCHFLLMRGLVMELGKGFTGAPGLAKAKPGWLAGAPSLAQAKLGWYYRGPRPSASRDGAVQGGGGEIPPPGTQAA